MELSHQPPSEATAPRADSSHGRGGHGGPSWRPVSDGVRCEQMMSVPIATHRFVGDQKIVLGECLGIAGRSESLASGWEFLKM
jgi:hypothetical protein